MVRRLNFSLFFLYLLQHFQFHFFISILFQLNLAVLFVPGSSSISSLLALIILCGVEFVGCRFSTGSGRRAFFFFSHFALISTRRAAGQLSTTAIGSQQTALGAATTSHHRHCSQDSHHPQKTVNSARKKEKERNCYLLMPNVNIIIIHIIHITSTTSLQK